MSARPSPGPSARLKQPHPPVGIAAGAEDAKYQTKYRELKRKVKDIETDNDKLHFKVLQAKRSIQRMKLERAILYERLAGISSPIDPKTRHGPPAPIQAHPPGPVPPFSRSRSGNDAGYPTGYEMPSHPGVVHTPRMHSPPRRSSGDTGHESRHMQHMPPPLPGSHGNSRPHVSPTMHHTRSHSSTRSRAHQQSYIPAHPHQYPEALPPVMHSPPIQERDRSRRHDNHDVPHADLHPHSRLSSFMPRLSPPPDSRRVHGHPPMSPGPPNSRDDYDYQRDYEHERSHSRDLGRNRDVSNSIVSPSMSHHTRQSFGRGDIRVRDEYYAGPHGGYAPHSRSGSPVSGSGSGIGNGSGGNVGVGGDISRPDSRHYYEPHERSSSTRAFKLRPVNPPNEEMDFVHEDGRSRDRGAAFEVSRKRGRNEMDVDDDVVDYTTGRVLEDRDKRYREHRRSIDNQDDVRIGPP
ncbi:hypothetical protein C0992_005929 [Termitomyces sp. T32_za158]|nr:hypothetical protein C0992_005929 [Termitomyces sp. T32_za158]